MEEFSDERASSEFNFGSLHGLHENHTEPQHRETIVDVCDDAGEDEKWRRMNR